MDYKETDVEAVEQNLRDAGCSDDFIAAFLRAWTAGATKEQLRLLAGQRCRLLDCVHAEQKKLDCLALISNEALRNTVSGIVTTVVTGGVAMVIIFAVDNKIFAPGFGEKK